MRLARGCRGSRAGHLCARHPPETRTAFRPDEALEAAEVYAAVAALPDVYRDVLVAVDVAGLSYKEAARALKTREGTVMSRLYRARQQVIRDIGR